ncbi:hypothetical protein [Abiotrophia defectiva]|uniref:hypothetical protein n=1 Tax=uncultured Abiotrophia sp. TaxID=316094 RepID=UPI0028D5F05E|nr:hypothetical protein [uncultured Abiotrophia sp.]
MARPKLWKYKNHSLAQLIEIKEQLYQESKEWAEKVKKDYYKRRNSGRIEPNKKKMR